MAVLPESKKFPFEEVPFVKRDPQGQVLYLQKLVRELEFVYKEIAEIVNQNTRQLGDVENGNYTEFASDGGIIFHGSGGLAFGHMTNDSGNTVTISVGGTWYEVTSGFVTGEVNLVSFGGDHYLSVTNAGKYLVSIFAALQGTTAGDKIGISAAINGTAQTAGHAHSTVGNANDQVGIATSYILDLAAGDEVSMAATNHTAGRDLDIIHSSMTIFQVGG